MPLCRNAGMKEGLLGDGGVGEGESGVKKKTQLLADRDSPKRLIST